MFARTLARNKAYAYEEKEVVKCACKKSSKELGKFYGRKVTRNQESVNARKVARN